MHFIRAFHLRIYKVFWKILKIRHLIDAERSFNFNTGILKKLKLYEKNQSREQILLNIHKLYIKMTRRAFHFRKKIQNKFQARGENLYLKKHRYFR